MCLCKRSSILRVSIGSALTAETPSGKSEMKCRSGSNDSGCPSGRSAPRRSKTNHCAACQCSGGILLSGRMRETCTMAAVNPRVRASCKNTLLSTARAAGFKPNEMFDSPRMMEHRGNRWEISRIPSSVSSPNFRSSAFPVAIVNVKGSQKRSDSSNPHLRVNKSWMRSAISNLRTAVFAMPACGSSSMVNATHAAPYFFKSGQMRFIRSSPSSKLIELTMQRPGACCNPASSTSACVESIINGAFTCRTNRAIVSDISRTPSRPTKSTQTSKT